MTHPSVNSRPRSGEDGASPHTHTPALYALASSEESKRSPGDSARSNAGTGKGEESSFREGSHEKFSKRLVALVCLLPNRENRSLSLGFWGDKDGSPGGRAEWDPANPSGRVRATGHGHSQAPAGAAAPHPPHLQPGGAGGCSHFLTENPEAVPRTSGKGGHPPPIPPRPRGQGIREEGSRSRWWRSPLTPHGSLQPSRPMGTPPLRSLSGTPTAPRFHHCPGGHGWRHPSSLVPSTALGSRLGTPHSSTPELAVPHRLERRRRG